MDEKQGSIGCIEGDYEEKIVPPTSERKGKWEMDMCQK
jgi:hypothetical protein